MPDNETRLVIHQGQWMPTSSQPPVSDIEQHLEQIRCILDKRALRSSLEGEIGHALSDQEVEEQQLTIWSQHVQSLIQIVEMGRIQLGILIVEGENQYFHKRFGDYEDMSDFLVNGLGYPKQHYLDAKNAYRAYSYACRFGLTLDDLCKASNEHIQKIGEMSRDVERQKQSLERYAVQVYAEEYKRPEERVSYEDVKKLPTPERREVVREADELYREEIRQQITNILGQRPEDLREDIAASGGEYNKPLFIIHLSAIAPNSIGGYSVSYTGGMNHMTPAQWDAIRHGKLTVRFQLDGSAQCFDERELGRQLEKIEQRLPRPVSYDERF